ncbi:class I SAM-dependent methyltransferase [Bradyrhizobium barranii subsp. apii]|uniref:class I SAM-dependent methyltransferase n=1 Tax=Bradyrhizobium barranii TaxID=2992140 RepID=UPI001AA0CEE6|nr:class I SAM-dependent methyltransferase [Bradyrhizobium barranii]UPT96064.1 class I SAM-dependent methyltransferase [Bradyrhizobium barranii subsp. apii]
MESVPLEQHQEHAKRLASIYGVTAALHAEDHMLRHFLEMNSENGLWHYFNGGYNDAAQLMTEIEKLGVDLQNLSVLEFASGYGRLTRHLKRLCNLSTSDIHSEAVEFVDKHCGVRTYQSSSNAEELKIDGQFDVVAVISLFSHLPDQTFGPWLAALYRLVGPGGHLIFTTVGDAAREINPTIAVPGPDGFIFTRDSEQKDIDGGEYGNTTARPHYVGFQIGKWLPSSKLVSYGSGTWWKYQDQYVVHKPSTER